MSVVWKCPKCGVILRKGSELLAEAIKRGESDVIGTATCGNCGAQYSQRDVYSGKYDVPEPPLPRRAIPEDPNAEMPELLLVLVDREPPGGTALHLQKLLPELPSHERGRSQVVQVTTDFKNQNFIAQTALLQGRRLGFEPDSVKLTWRTYSTVDGVNGVLVKIYKSTKEVKKENKLNSTHPLVQDQKRYKEALKLISDINQYIDQDGSGAGYDEKINTLVHLSPDSIRCIYDIWRLNAPASESTDRLLVEVLGSIAKKRPSEEQKLAIDTLQKALDLPDDNTTRPMRRRDACIHVLDELKALPGVDYSQMELPAIDKPFRLEPIDLSEIGPMRSDSPQDKPNLEASALWQLILYPQQQYEEVVQRFEANYTRWSKTFDHRSLSLVLCAYGSALKELGRYCDALIAHRWACKIYPYRGFSSCQILERRELEAKANEELKKKRLNLKDKEEICEYCFKIIDEHKQVRIFNEKIVCEECDKKLRGSNIANQADILLELIEKGDIEGVQRHINAGVNINIWSHKGTSPLQNAVRKNHIEIVKLLLNKGADINAQDNYGFTPLMYAVYNEYGDKAPEKMVEFLLRNGADPNLCSKDGESPLRSAMDVFPRPEATIALLLKYGAK